MKQRLLVLIVLLGPLVWLLGRALVSNELFVFRDVAHYYYPLYNFVAAQWADGRVPLWNPQENMGQPLLADATSAVLYPGKLIFLLPLGYATNFKLYIVGHVLLAVVAAYIAARGFARTAPAAALCGLSYAFSGSVLFQYCNVPYLVSAAWLPMTILAIDRMLTRRSWKWAAVLAATLAMMILGGDPQMAYHAMLIAGLYVVVLWWMPQSRPPVPGGSTAELTSIRASGREGTRGLHWNHPLLLIFGASLLTALLAAVQILPSAQWSRTSTRAAYDAPRNVYEMATSLGENDRADADGRFAFLLGHTVSEQHLETYHFSVGPWHAADFLWPNCFGRVFPTNTRWIRALSAEGRTWTPTLYMGLLPLLLALSQFRLFGRAKLLLSRDAIVGRVFNPSRTEWNSVLRARRTWLSWLVLLALFAAMGWYGLGWIVMEVYQAICGADAQPLPIGSPFGGLYWLMQTLLPGYVYFRFPAKLLTVAAIGLSLLAAFGWDELGGQARRFVVRGLVIVFILTVAFSLADCVSNFATSYWKSLAEITPKDALFGPLDVIGARDGLLSGLLHTAVVACLSWLLLSPLGKTRGALTMLLLLTALDIAIAQRNIIPTMPAETIQQNSTLAAIMLRNNNPSTPTPQSPPLIPTRVYRPYWLPDAWAYTSSPDRQIAGAHFDRQTLFPKYHLLEDVEVVQSTGGAMESADHREFISVVRRHKLLAEIGTQFVIGPAGEGKISAKAHRLAAAPRAWIVHKVEVLPPLASPHPSDVRKRTREVLAPDGPRDLSSVAVVETSEKLPSGIEISSADVAIERCEVTRFEPDHVEIYAELAQPGLVVLADTFTPDWVCEAKDLVTDQSREIPVFRTNRVMRGVWLPAGTYELTFRYRPQSFYAGAIISAAAWLGLLVAASIGLARRRRQ